MEVYCNKSRNPMLTGNDRGVLEAISNATKILIVSREFSIFTL